MVVVVAVVVVGAVVTEKQQHAVESSMTQKKKERWFHKYQVDIPDGKKNNWCVEKFDVGPETAFASLLQDGLRPVPQGTYTRLCGPQRGLYEVVMSDTPAEIKDHLDFIWQAQGDVLIHGLGIGMCLQAVARKEEVTSVLVIEKSQDVIDLVAPTYLERFGDKLEIRQEDALTWKPEKGRRWDCVWHDIWYDICAGNYEQMKKLHRRFGRRCDWQDSWSRDQVKRIIRRESYSRW